MKKLTAAMLIITAAFFLGLGVVSKPLMADTSENDKNHRDVYLNIMTINKPQYEMIKKLCGDKHNVQYMFNEAKDVKEYKYDKGIINNISNMDLFFYSGSYYNNTPINNMVSELDKSSLGVINLSRGIRELQTEVDNKTVTNPYYYLGIPEYKIMIYNAKSALQEKDPANRNFYEENYNNLVKQLDEIQKNFEKNSSEYKKFKFILEDNSLEYFFRGVGLNIEVLPKDKFLEDYIKDNKLKASDVVFVQNEYGKDIKLPKEVKNIKLNIFDDNKEFIDIIQSNIKKIQTLVKNK